MPTFLITKKIKCSNTKSCANTIKNKIKDKFNLEDLTWHVSIYHEQDNHLIFVCLYDKDNEHLAIEKIETEDKNEAIASYHVLVNDKLRTRYVKGIKTVKTTSDIIKKCKVKITENELKKLI